MVEAVYPGMYVEEVGNGVHSIAHAPTSVCAFVGYTRSGSVDTPVRISCFNDFEREFGKLQAASPVGYAVLQFFTNGGSAAVIVRVAAADGSPANVAQLIGDRQQRSGLYALLNTEFNLLAIPETYAMANGEEAAVVAAGVALCEAQQAFYIVDAPAHCTLDTITQWAHGVSQSSHAATYFPAVRIVDPQGKGELRTLAPSGTLAGIYARTDAQRGVWKAPAGVEADLRGVVELASALNDMQNGQINPQAVNVLRSFPAHGRVAWGARTLRGSDARADEYKYISVRRLALFLEQSLLRGTQWAVFEPNDEALWVRLRQTAEMFLYELFGQGALEGKNAQQAYFVRCDGTTTSALDRTGGIVNLQIGFAPLRPAEFVLLNLQQHTLKPDPG